MPKLSDKVVSDSYIRAVFKGEPGTHKSVESSFFPEPIYIFDFDGKIDVLKKHRPKGDIEYDTYDFGTNPKLLVSKLNEKFEDIQVHTTKYQTVILDSLSALVMKILAYSLSFRGRADKDKSKQIGEILLPEFDDFNAETNVLSTVISFAKSIPSNVILIAHVIPDNKGINRKLFTAGKAASAMIPALFNEVYHFEGVLDNNPGGDGKIKYQVRTTNTGIDFARTALNLPEVVNIQNGGDLFKKIEEVRKYMDRVNNAVEVK